ncbi:hypothetical protein JM654_04080 [Microbacterium oxydans]|nr:hypothetical protein [Microbacterium oxydans]
MGTVAPTAPNDSVDLAVALFSPALYVVAAGYAAVGLALVWLAISLAPWGPVHPDPGVRRSRRRSATSPRLRSGSLP